MSGHQSSQCACVRQRTLSSSRPGKMYTCLLHIWVMRVRHVKPCRCCSREDTQESQSGQQHTHTPTHTLCGERQVMFKRKNKSCVLNVILLLLVYFNRENFNAVHFICITFDMVMLASTQMLLCQFHYVSNMALIGGAWSVK